MKIAVIDIGKTNAKVVLVDLVEPGVIASRTRANPVLAAPPYPHADVDGLWNFILDSLGFIAQSDRIEAISITTHGATAALIDDKGLVLPVMDYEFDGPEELAGEYASVRPSFVESLSPRLPNGLNLGAQLFFQAQRFTDAFASARHILMYPQYWAWRLTGIAASEVTSLGCHSDLWSHPDAALSSLVARMGWRNRFPPLRSAASTLGPLSDGIARSLGLPDGVPVGCGIHDSNASLVPYLDQDQPLTVISTGTWTVCMTIGGGAENLDERRDSLGNVDARGRTVPTARFMGGREFNLLVETPVTQPSEAELRRVVAERIMVLPSLVRGTGPFPGLTGGWSANATSLSAGERYAAASLYLALMTVESLGLCGIGRAVVIEGPLARNAVYAGALALWLRVPVRISADATGTSLGAAMLLDPASIKSLPEAAVSLDVEGLEAYRQHWLAGLRAR